MNRLFLAFAVVSFTSVSTGCYKVTVVNNGATGQGSPAEYTDRWNHNAVLGLANFSGPQDATAACPNGWATVETQQDFD